MYYEDFMMPYNRYVNLISGKPIKRTPNSHPYSFDEYKVYKKDNFRSSDDNVYSDRLYQWDPDKYNECRIEIFGNQSQYFDGQSPEDIGKFLSKYFDKNVEVTAIVKGCNISNGYPYWLFYYKEDEQIV